jgi:AcrR family transcriptional regulator
MGLREEKKRETRAGILTTAVELFREHGYERTRVQDVAERLRISEATFFNYFPTKHAVLEAVADERLDDAVERLRQAAAGDGRPALARLEDLVRTFAAGFAHDRELAELLVAHTRFAQGETERGVRAHTLLTGLLADGQRQGEIRADVAASDLAALVMAFILAMIGTWVAEDGSGPGLEERMQGAFAVFAAGAAATAATATPVTDLAASPAEVVGA